MRRLLAPIRWALLVLLILPAAALAAPPDDQIVLRPGVRVPLLAGPGTSPTRVRPRISTSAAAPTATIQVTYHGFSPAAQAAFQAAVDIWQTQITSSVPIKVDAYWELLGTGILGSAGPGNFISFSGSQTPQGALSSTWYPIALANKLAGKDLDTANADIEASFNSGFSGWYFGTDGKTPSGQYDFVTTVLHELGHGLGFVGSIEVSKVDGRGQWGVFGSQFTGKPLAFDRFAVNGAGQQLINTGAFPNPSSALALQLTSGSIFFDGPRARSGAGGARARLYAPPNWQAGSSFSHLDEDDYPAGDSDSLMTPALDHGESIHDPGLITLGIFADMGWTTVSDQPVAGLAASSDGPTTIGSPTKLTASVTGGTNISYTWNFGDGATGSGATVSHTYASLGSYTATVTAANAAGTKTATTTVVIRDAAITGLAASSNAPTNLGNPTTLTATIGGGTNVRYTWDFGDGTTGVGAAASHSYKSTGSYTATITAMNSADVKKGAVAVKVLPATQAITATSGVTSTLMTPDGSIKITIPPGTLSTTVTVTYTALPAPGHPLAVDKRAVRSFTLEARTSAGAPVTTLAKPITLVIGYTDADLAARAIFEDSRMDLVAWDGSAWTSALTCAGCGVNSATNRATVTLTRLGEFALIGQGQQFVYLPVTARTS